jgi:hypothetical protein
MLAPQNELLEKLMARLEASDAALKLANEKIAELTAAQPAKRKRGRPRKQPVAETPAVQPEAEAKPE